MVKRLNPPLQPPPPRTSTDGLRGVVSAWDRRVAVGINVGHMRPVLRDVEARMLIHELREDRPGRTQASARSAAAKIEAENAQPPTGTPVELAAEEMVAVRHALDEIGRARP